MKTLRAVVVLALLSACGSSKKEAGKDGGAPAAPAPAAGPTLKVSKPSKLAVAALAKVKQPRALLFLDPGPVADQVVGYLGDLARQAGVKLEVRELDRLVAPDEAKLHKVASDALVLVSGERSERIRLAHDPRMGEKMLAGLDADVSRSLERLARSDRAAAIVRHPAAGAYAHTLFTQAVTLLGYKVTTVKPGDDVPAGALAILLDTGEGPLEPAVASIDRHLAAGGSALLALEPARGASLGPLAARLGVELGKGALADEKEHMVMKRDVTDNGLVMTNGFAAHPSIATLSRAPTRSGALFVESGHLVETGVAPQGVTRVVVIKSMTSSFVDADGDHTRDKAEAQRAHPIAIAVSWGAATPQRALVVADASWLNDQLLRQVPTAQHMLLDAIRWLAGDETLSDEAGVPAPVTGDQLTSYPARAAPPAAASAVVPIWEIKPSDVRTVRYTDETKSVLIERRDGALWGRVERMGADGTSARDFPMSAEGNDLFARAARPLPLRALGPLDDAAAETYQLGPARLTVEHAGGSHSLQLGGRVFGGSDRYVADPAQKRAFILAHAMLDLERAELLAVRDPLGLEEAALTKLVIARDGKSREATRAQGGTWTVAGGTPDQAFAIDYIAREAPRLAPMEFALTAPKGLTLAATLTFTAGGTAVALEIFTGPDSRTWIRSPLTRVHARVPTDRAARLLEALEQLMP